MVNSRPSESRLEDVPVFPAQETLPLIQYGPLFRHCRWEKRERMSQKKRSRHVYGLRRMIRAGSTGASSLPVLPPSLQTRSRATFTVGWLAARGRATEGTVENSRVFELTGVGSPHMTEVEMMVVSVTHSRASHGQGPPTTPDQKGIRRNFSSTETIAKVAGKAGRPTVPVLRGSQLR